MTTTRKQYSPKFKARVAIEAIRGREDAEPVGIAVQGASDADRQVAEGGAGADCRNSSWTGGRGRARNEDADNDALYEEIGRLKVELDWLKKKAGMLD